MNNRTERDEFLNELLGEDLRASSLAHVLDAARRAKRMRRARRSIAIAALLVASATAFFFRGPTSQPVQVVSPPEPAIRIISDDELLARFPGRAVALVGPPEHRQLIFLDAAR